MHEHDQVADFVASEPIGPQRAAAAASDATIAGDVAGDASANGVHETVAEAEDWRYILDTSFRMLFGAVSRVWPEFKLEDSERTELVKVWSPVCEKHIGSAASMEVVAVGVTVAMLAPKGVAAWQGAKARRRVREVPAEVVSSRSERAT